MYKKFFVILLFLAGGYCVSNAQDTAGKSFPPDPAYKPVPDSLRGEILKVTYKNSRLYPGTIRTYTVYVPKQYKSGMPACLYVCMDGIMFDAPRVFDNLIHSKEMPVTIGVFIESGTIRSADSTVIRYNRTNEFDNLNDRFVRFIEEEILPNVERHKTSDGRSITISKKAEDRAIAGASSGAICAFTAAWERPDLFSRVFSSIGTYVGMRGGDQYPALIRKTEPKAIRVYLQDNTSDTWNPLFGNWYNANIDMEAALNFAGYEVTHKWLKGGHDTGPANSIFAEAMRWLWKSWPAPVRSGHSANDMLRTLIDTNEHWQWVGPIVQKNKMGSLAGIRLPLSDGKAYLLQAGTIRYQNKGQNRVVDADQNLGEGLAISPGKRQLVASISHSYWLYDYTIESDGSLSNKQRLYWLHNPDNDDTHKVKSMAFDTNGNLYVATTIGVQICDQNGRVRAILSLPQGPIDNLYFDSTSADILYVSCAGNIYKRKLKTRGAPSQAKAQVPVSQGAG